MPKQHRVPEMPSARPMAAARPRCSRCNTLCEKNDIDEWYCPSCADAWLQAYVEGKVSSKSVGGVELPKGMRDDRRVTPTFRDVIGNRAQRRAAARRERHGRGR